MVECEQCGRDFETAFACSVCDSVYCLSHRRSAQHDCIDVAKPHVRPLTPEHWSSISHAVNKLLFVVLSLSLLLFLVELLL